MRGVRGCAVPCCAVRAVMSNGWFMHGSGNPGNRSVLSVIRRHLLGRLPACRYDMRYDAKYCYYRFTEALAAAGGLNESQLTENMNGGGGGWHVTGECN